MAINHSCGGVSISASTRPCSSTSDGTTERGNPCRNTKDNCPPSPAGNEKPGTVKQPSDWPTVPLVLTSEESNISDPEPSPAEPSAARDLNAWGTYPFRSTRSQSKPRKNLCCLISGASNLRAGSFSNKALHAHTAGTKAPLP